MTNQRAGQTLWTNQRAGETLRGSSPVVVAHAPVDAVGVVTDRKDGSLVVERVHLVREEPADGAKQQAANPESVLPLTSLHHGGNLPRLIPLHKHPTEHGEAPELRVVWVCHHCGVGGLSWGGGGGAAGGPVPTKRNRPGLMEVAEHCLILEGKSRVCVRS